MPAIGGIAAGISSAQTVQPVAKKTTSGGKVGLDQSERIHLKDSAMIHLPAFTREQMPEPLESGVGSTPLMQRQKAFTQSATLQRSLFVRSGIPEPAPSKVGSTQILQRQKFFENSATINRSLFIRKNIPDPLPSSIGTSDLPGGFKWDGIISGRKQPTYDLANGIVQIDDVKVLFDARM